MLSAESILRRAMFFGSVASRAKENQPEMPESKHAGAPLASWCDRVVARSEARRVGKECRSGASAPPRRPEPDEAHWARQSRLRKSSCVRDRERADNAAPS